MSKWKVVPFLLILAALLLTGCQPGESEPEVAIASPMVMMAEAKFPYPYIDIATYNGDPPPDDLMVASSVPPYYNIVDGYLMSCLGQDFIVLQVQNLSGWTFQYLTMGASNGADSWYIWPKSYLPFHYAGNECPKAPPFSHLAPGETAYIYLEVDHTWGNNTYDIWLNMCTYVGDPPSDDENCVLKHYILTVEEPPYKIIFLEVAKEWLCWVGPGPMYETVGAIFPGEAVQLLALSEEAGKLAILHPKYSVLCFTDDHALKIVDDRLLEGQDTEPSPALPPDCPPGFKYDYDLGECVKKDNDCRSITSEKICNNTPGCWWDPAVDECY